MAKKIIGTVFFLIGFIVLLSLGIWQIQRLAWKTDIIDRLDVEYAKNPAESILQFNDLKNLNAVDIPLRYGAVHGTFLYNDEIYLGPKTQDGKIGFHVITPFEIKGGIILVNRGWIAKTDTEMESLPQLSGRKQITGLIRKPDWNRFTPANSPENNIWIRPNINEIAHAKGLKNVSPVMLYQNAEKWYPRNKHRDYAIFWCTLAIIWLGFGIYLGLLHKR